MRYNQQMQILKIIFASLLFICLARAGDAANLELIGFSKDGRYLAFEQFGTTDGAGFPYSKFSVVEVSKNTLLEQTEKMIERDGATVSQARTALRASSTVVQKRYGIVTGLQGRFIGIAPTAPNLGGQRSQFVANGKTYDLTLNSTSADVDSKTCPDKTESRLELTLTVAGKSRTLQKDSSLPKSRACALSYQMRSAHLLGGNLAVFVEVQTPGFEGADVRWMVVTAKL